MANYPNLISAKIVADSITEKGHRMTTFELVFPRFILAELNTHSMLKRNSASSRAIPFNKMVTEVMERPFIPIAWQKHHSGMQGSDYHTGQIAERDAPGTWLRARDYAVQQATLLYNNCKVTKQICNRMLEPYMYHKVLLTGTEFQNFFDLRSPQYHTSNARTFKSKKEVIEFFGLSQEQSDVQDWLSNNKGMAEIHIMDLAEKMYDAYNESIPTSLKEGEWHIPYGDNIDKKALKEYLFESTGEIHNRTIDLQKSILKIAIARCARLSYQTLGDNPTIDFKKDIELYEVLLNSKHMSPFEHLGRVMTETEYMSNVRGDLFEFVSKDTDGELFYREIFEQHLTEEQKQCFGWNKNLRGFIQYRSLVE